MDKNAHKGFSLAGSAVLNSLIYDVYPHVVSSSPVDIALYSVGQPYNFAAFTHGFPAGLGLETISCKIVFFSVAVLAASFPDRIEKRDKGIIGGHRGLSHSLLFLFLLLSCSIFIDGVLETFLPSILQHLVGAASFGLFSAILWHIVADMWTKQGVKVLWPDQTSFGWLPKGIRPTNNAFFAYVILWAFMGLVGFLFAKGIVGL